MATSRGFGQFSRRMKIVAKTIEKNSEKVIRQAALAADSAAVLATPVDTGRARGNWLVGIGSINELMTERLDKSGAGTIADAARTLEGWRLGSGTIFISNSVPYIIPLENGHSKQAPGGMSASGILAARTVLRRAKLLKE